jgi:F-type H+-transporting ATPase subunit alpha
VKEEMNPVTKAILTYVTPPTDDQIAGVKRFLAKKLGVDNIELECVEDASIGSGFVIRAGNHEYDWSAKGRMDQLQQKVQSAVASNKFKQEDLITLLKQEISDFSLDITDKEVGVVTSVADATANVEGINHAFYGEIVVFDNNVRGMVLDIRKDDIGVILFDSEAELREGSHVVRTGKMASIPVGDQFLGRVVNALGDPIDGQGEIANSGYRPIEFNAPSIVARKPVSVPMQTGILSIDAMFPIARGQRELIIGDRQTGKTSIATDTILNQKDNDVICIYVGIGQKASTIAKIANMLKQNGAMDYTVIFSATASEPAALQYIIPYSATALAEHFMYSGHDVLIIYDDLSKHAVAYRAISLLLGRSPGREAYPGDVFYLHSRLLERSARLNDEAGKGSITALPVIETQAGDVSAYIPTNVISITDGQIFLESELFFSGQRPAVNVGLSVSRVGGAAQTKATKKAAGSLRVDLAQYREMEVFTQFSSELDDKTKAQLNYGRSLMELLKQPLGHPISMADQVITLVAATNRTFANLPVEDIKPFQGEMLEFIHRSHAEIVNELETKKTLEDSLKSDIIAAVEEFKASKGMEVKKESAGKAEEKAEAKAEAKAEEAKEEVKEEAKEEAKEEKNEG